MHQHDIFRAWVTGITKTGTEQQNIDKLVDVLDCLLAFPKAQTLPAYQKYELVRQNAKPGKHAGVDMLTDALIDLSAQLQRG